jgi:hypothetical protein
MIFRFKPVISAVIFLLVACSPRTVVSPVDTAQPAQPPAATSTAVPSATPTPAVPTVVPTRLQPAPTNPAAHVNLALPAPQPLSAGSPWLMFPCAAAPANHAPSIANGDGSGCVAVTLPSAIPADRTWISAAALRGYYAAFRDIIQTPAVDPSTPDAAYRFQQNGLDDQLWIVKFPENRIVRIIPQIDPDGWARIEQAWQKLSNQNSEAEKSVPLPLAVIRERGAYGWSPNGRFLAYTGVDKTGVDLFVYDSQNDTIRRMTRGRQGAFFWSWSPDGQWIVYREMSGCRLENGICQLQQGPDYYAVTFPAPEYQFENKFPAGQIDWIAKDRYILQDIPAPGQPHTQLVEVNLNYGTVTQLYNQPFFSYTYVPNTYVSKAELYLLNLAEVPARDRVTGVYLLTPRTGELKPFHTDKFAAYTIQWERSLERFILSKDVTSGPPIQKDVLLAPIQMVDSVPMGILGSSTFYVSPDGNWFTTMQRTGNWALYTAQGKLVLDLGYGITGQVNPPVWLKKSGGFFFYTSGQQCVKANNCIFFFDKDQDWKSTLVGEITAQPDDLQVIAP